MSYLDDPRVLFATERTLLAWNRPSPCIAAPPSSAAWPSSCRACCWRPIRPWCERVRVGHPGRAVGIFEGLIA